MANWKGTAVPNTGNVEKVYFNTNLTVEEVYNLVNSLDHDFSTIPDYFILTNKNWDVQLFITSTNPSESFVICWGIGDNEAGIIFSYNGLEEYGVGDGWQTFNNPFTFNITAISEDEGGIPFGVENDKLSSLFSITPFEEEVTLEGLLTDTCEAIREKEGTADKILALDIPSRIRALSSGGIEGIIEVEELPLPRDWQGTAIPNSGTVENVYFNTNLSVEEVVNILQTLELNSEGVYYILYNHDNTDDWPIQITAEHLTPEDAWVITGHNFSPLYFISKPVSGISHNAGWQTFDNPVSFNLGASSSTGEFNVGNQNDKLSKIISSSPIEPIVNDIDTSKVYYLNQGVSDVYAFMGDSWVSMKDSAESYGGKFDVIVVKDKPTENIKVSESDIFIVGYFVENENDIFLYVDRTGEGDLSWLSLSEAVFAGDATYGGHITDVSEATDPTKYYNTTAVQKFYKYSNGWIEYKYGGIIPDGTWTVSRVAPYNETIDISKYQYVEINVSGGSGQYRITSNGVYDIERYSSVDVNVLPSGGTKSITSNGVYDVSDYASVDVNVSTSQTSQDDGLIEGTLTTYTNDRVTSIRNFAFDSCSKLTSVDFPKVTSIGNNAFDSCSALTSVDFPLVTSIGNNAFDSCSALTSVSFPLATSIISYAFDSCSKLTSVDFPKVTSIGSNAFSYCVALTSVSFPLATSIGTYAFSYCSALTSVSFPLVTSIGGNAFSSCRKLTSVDFPNATSIGGNNAFSGCNSLTKLIIRTTSQVCTLSNTNAFQNCYHILGTTNAIYNPEGLKDGYIYVPDELVESYKTATNWSEYASQIKPLSEYVEE